MEFPTAIDPPDTRVTRPRRLQLGCGGRFHAGWTNLDLHPQHSSVRRHDVAAPLPFPSQHFDAVYHAHLLEHLPRDQAARFLCECFRVLRPGGVLRVVVPDLEQIARMYLESLGGAWEGDEGAKERHAWAMLELYDQAVRERQGGAMLEYLAAAVAAPTALAWRRLGSDGTVIRTHFESLHRNVGSTATTSAARPSFLHRCRQLLQGNWRERLLRWVLGREYELLHLGRFRRAGEIHLWMYDRYSLRELLTEAGFAAFRLTTAGESSIPAWTEQYLDTQPDGSATKPDSLSAEAVRP
jgi:predicted SAM-dependent methyltransferase